MPKGTKNAQARAQAAQSIDQTTTTAEEAEANLKELLGEEDFNELMQIRTRKADRATRARIKELADGMCTGDGGKYQVEYAKLDTALMALYEKAQNEAKAIVEADAAKGDDEPEDEKKDDAKKAPAAAS